MHKSLSFMINVKIKNNTLWLMLFLSALVSNYKHRDLNNILNSLKIKRGSVLAIFMDTYDINVGIIHVSVY